MQCKRNEQSLNKTRKWEGERRKKTISKLIQIRSLLLAYNRVCVLKQPVSYAFTLKNKNNNVWAFLKKTKTCMTIIMR